jgi:hypothetical protein
MDLTASTFRGVLGTIVGAAIAGLAIELLRQRARRRRQASVDVGAAVEVPGKLRLLAGAGIAGRWREGFVVRDGEKVFFRPRRPRAGRRIDLTGSTITGTRPRARFEFWWFAGPNVLTLAGPPGGVELAGGSDADIDLLAQLFRR